MSTQFDPGELWQAVQPFVQTGVQRLGEDRTEELNARQASLALVYDSSQNVAKVVYSSSLNGTGPEEMMSSGPDDMPAGMTTQFQSFLSAGKERLDPQVREQVEKEVAQGAQLLAVLDFSGRTLKGVMMRPSSQLDAESVVELFSLALD